MRQNGFTLAELLISLAILGVIATFTIPKILHGQDDAQRKAVLKESIALFAQIVHEGVISGQLTDPLPSPNMDYFTDKVNAVRICPTDSNTEGCWSHAAPGPNFGTQLGQAGFVLHNGAVVAGIDDTNGYNFEFFAIDWNGSDGPNQEGDDQIMLSMCWSSGATCADGTRRDTVVGRAANPVSVTMYRAIFTN